MAEWGEELRSYNDTASSGLLQATTFREYVQEAKNLSAQIERRRPSTAQTVYLSEKLNESFEKYAAKVETAIAERAKFSRGGTSERMERIAADLAKEFFLDDDDSSLHGNNKGSSLLEWSTGMNYQTTLRNPYLDPKKYLGSRPLNNRGYRHYFNWSRRSILLEEKMRQYYDIHGKGVLHDHLLVLCKLQAGSVLPLVDSMWYCNDSSSNNSTHNNEEDDQAVPSSYNNDRITERLLSRLQCGDHSSWEKNTLIKHNHIQTELDPIVLTTVNDFLNCQKLIKTHRNDVLAAVRFAKDSPAPVHTEHEAEYKVDAMLIASTADGYLHLRPLCNSADVALALNELTDPYIFEAGFVQLPHILNFRYQQWSGGYYRYLYRAKHKSSFQYVRVRPPGEDHDLYVAWTVAAMSMCRLSYGNPRHRTNSRRSLLREQVEDIEDSQVPASLRSFCDTAIAAFYRAYHASSLVVLEVDMDIEAIVISHPSAAFNLASTSSYSHSSSNSSSSNGTTHAPHRLLSSDNGSEWEFQYRATSFHNIQSKFSFGNLRRNAIFGLHGMRQSYLRQYHIHYHDCLNRLRLGQHPFARDEDSDDAKKIAYAAARKWHFNCHKQAAVGSEAAGNSSSDDDSADEDDSLDKVIKSNSEEEEDELNLSPIIELLMGSNTLSAPPSIMFASSSQIEQEEEQADDHHSTIISDMRAVEEEESLHLLKRYHLLEEYQLRAEENSNQRQSSSPVVLKKAKSPYHHRNSTTSRSPRKQQREEENEEEDPFPALKEEAAEAYLHSYDNPRRTPSPTIYHRVVIVDRNEHDLSMQEMAARQKLAAFPYRSPTNTKGSPPSNDRPKIVFPHRHSRKQTDTNAKQAQVDCSKEINLQDEQLEATVTRFSQEVDLALLMRESAVAMLRRTILLQQSTEKKEKQKQRSRSSSMSPTSQAGRLKSDSFDLDNSQHNPRSSSRRASLQQRGGSFASIDPPSPPISPLSVMRKRLDSCQDDIWGQLLVEQQTVMMIQEIKKEQLLLQQKRRRMSVSFDDEENEEVQRLTEGEANNQANDDEHNKLHYYLIDEEEEDEGNQPEAAEGTEQKEEQLGGMNVIITPKKKKLKGTKANSAISHEKMSEELEAMVKAILSKLRPGLVNKIQRALNTYHDRLKGLRRRRFILRRRGAIASLDNEMIEELQRFHRHFTFIGHYNSQDSDDVSYDGSNGIGLGQEKSSVLDLHSTMEGAEELVDLSHLLGVYADASHVQVLVEARATTTSGEGSRPRTRSPTMIINSKAPLNRRQSTNSSRASTPTQQAVMLSTPRHSWLLTKRLSVLMALNNVLIDGNTLFSDYSHHNQGHNQEAVTMAAEVIKEEGSSQLSSTILVQEEEGSSSIILPEPVPLTESEKLWGAMVTVDANDENDDRNKQMVQIDKIDHVDFRNNSNDKDEDAAGDLEVDQKQDHDSTLLPLSAVRQVGPSLRTVHWQEQTPPASTADESVNVIGWRRPTFRHVKDISALMQAVGAIVEKIEKKQPESIIQAEKEEEKEDDLMLLLQQSLSSSAKVGSHHDPLLLKNNRDSGRLASRWTTFGKTVASKEETSMMMEPRQPSSARPSRHASSSHGNYGRHGRVIAVNKPHSAPSLTSKSNNLEEVEPAAVAAEVRLAIKGQTLIADALSAPIAEAQDIYFHRGDYHHSITRDRSRSRSRSKSPPQHPASPLPFYHTSSSSYSPTAANNMLLTVQPLPRLYPHPPHAQIEDDDSSSSQWTGIIMESDQHYHRAVHVYPSFGSDSQHPLPLISVSVSTVTKDQDDQLSSARQQRIKPSLRYIDTREDHEFSMMIGDDNVNREEEQADSLNSPLALSSPASSIRKSPKTKASSSFSFHHRKSQPAVHRDDDPSAAVANVAANKQRTTKVKKKIIGKADLLPSTQKPQLSASISSGGNDIDDDQRARGEDEAIISFLTRLGRSQWSTGDDDGKEKGRSITT